MNNELITLILKLREMSSKDAADWIMKCYPREDVNHGVAIDLIPHRSWKKEDQVRLAVHYLQRLPHASDRAYKAFASFMSLNNFLMVVKMYLPTSELDIKLLLYYLKPVLYKMAKSDKDVELVNAFISEVE